VFRRGAINGLLPGRLPSPREYLGCEDFLVYCPRSSNAQAISYIANMLLCTATLTALLVIGGMEQNPGPGVEVENSLQILCTGC
jgi:hypothetical protein